LDDINALINETSKYLSGTLPKFLYGQGFGGTLAIHFGLHKSSVFQGFIVTSPALARTTPQSWLYIGLTQATAKLMPGLQSNNRLETDALSRNIAIVQAYRNDAYVHNKLSARMIVDILESGRYALNNASQWVFPLLLMHGSADQITACSASQEFARNAPGPVEFILWNGYYHELHNDLGSEAVISKIIQWLNDQVDE
jgi:alpha-beta hydrolase superfamily lysophospholipase